MNKIYWAGIRGNWEIYWQIGATNKLKKSETLLKTRKSPVKYVSKVKWAVLMLILNFLLHLIEGASLYFFKFKSLTPIDGYVS